MQTAKQRKFPNIKKEGVCDSNIINCMDERILISKNIISVNNMDIDLGSNTHKWSVTCSNRERLTTTMNSQLTELSVVIG